MIGLKEQWGVEGAIKEKEEEEEAKEGVAAAAQ